MASIARKNVLTRDGQMIGVTFDFKDGGSYAIELDDMSEEMVRHAAIHGLLQKLGDAYANAKGDPKIAEGLFLPVYEAIIAGEWNRKGNRGAGGLEILIQALGRLTGKDEAVIRAKVTAMGKDEVKALKARADVAKAIKEIELERAEKAAEGADTDDLGDLF